MGERRSGPPPSLDRGSGRSGTRHYGEKLFLRKQAEGDQHGEPQSREEREENYKSESGSLGFKPETFFFIFLAPCAPWWFDPTDVIVKTVKEKNIDLLVMLAHEEGHLEHFLFGRSNHELVLMMPCSILLVKKEPQPVAS
jgi:hypothetical protein